MTGSDTLQSQPMRRVNRLILAVLLTAGGSLAVSGCGPGEESKPNPEFEVPKIDRPSRSAPGAADPVKKKKDGK